MSTLEKLKELNRERKGINLESYYFWGDPSDWLKLKKKRKKIEKQIFKIIDEL